MNSIDDILKMAANVQEQITAAQANLDSIEVEGAAILRISSSVFMPAHSVVR